MKKFRDFKCSESKQVFERLVEDDETIVNCNCKGLASRCLSAPKFIYSLGNNNSRR